MSMKFAYTSAGSWRSPQWLMSIRPKRTAASLSFVRSVGATLRQGGACVNEQKQMASAARRWLESATDGPRTRRAGRDGHAVPLLRDAGRRPAQRVARLLH